MNKLQSATLIAALTLAIAGILFNSVTDVKLSRRSNQSNSEWKMIWQGDWGDWTKRIIWESSSGYACGAQIRVESNQGKEGDDTSMNGIKFVTCQDGDWGSQKTMTIAEGFWGDWSRPTAMCPNEGFIIGIQIRYEDRINGDNTAMNGFKFLCDKSPQWITVGEGNWGNWKAPVTFQQSPAKLICGARTRIQPQQEGGDDTAMNGLEVMLCPKASQLQLINLTLDWGKAVYNNADKNIKSQEIINNDPSSDQVSQYQIQFTEEESTTYETSDSYAAGLSIETSAEFSVGLATATVSVTASFEYTKTFTFGKASTKSRTESYSSSLNVKACRRGIVTAEIPIVDATIPYTMTLRDKVTKKTYTVRGSYKNRGMGQIRATYTSKPLQGCTPL